MKDDDALEASLIQSALDNALLFVGGNNPPISGVGLEKLVLEYQLAMGIHRPLIATLSSLIPEGSYLSEIQSMKRGLVIVPMWSNSQKKFRSV